MEHDVNMEEKNWERIVNTIVRWIGIVLMAVLFVVTAGVDLYRNHFKLFVVTLCLLPVGFCIDRAISRWAKKTIKERLDAQPPESALQPRCRVLQKKTTAIITPSISRSGSVGIVLQRKRAKQTGHVRASKSNRLWR